MIATTAIIPESARLQVRSWLTVDQLKDLSVSRPSSRLSWGVAVPGDPSQTVRPVSVHQPSIAS